MYICKNCNHTSETQLNFCPICGNQMVLEETATAEAAATYQNPVVYTQPTPVNKPSMVKKIVGMALSIEGFMFAVITAIYALIFLLAAATSGETEMGLASLVLTFFMAIFGLPGSIIGLGFSNSARNLGDTSAFSRVGKALGLAGIIIFAACFVISLFATVVGV